MRDPLKGPSRQGVDYGEAREGNGLHPAVQREKREPRVGLEPLSVWLIALYAITIFAGAFYIGRYSGDFSADSLDPGSTAQLVRKSSAAAANQQTAELSPAERGKKVFLANCVTCPQAS